MRALTIAAVSMLFAAPVLAQTCPPESPMPNSSSRAPW